MSPSACFISDAHLGVRGAGWQEREARLLSFLRQLDQQVTHLIIVGDLFDFWIEYRNLIRAEYFDTLRILADLRERGTQLHYIAGNHDFALGPFLLNQIGMHVHTRSMDCELMGARIHVRHGDGILPSDVLYRLLHRVLRSRLNQRLYKMLHPTLGIGLAALASRLSRHGSSGRPLKGERVKAYRQAAKGLLERTGAQIVVLGHTHTPELVQGPSGTYCNTGAWLNGGSYALLRDGRIGLWRLEQGTWSEVQPLDW
jgi:UDP-2,3-diacylglucosamine hydrolase